MDSTDVVISVSEDWLDRMPELVTQLQSVGLTNVNVLSAIGMITGTVNATQMATIATLPGVMQIEPTQEVQICLPDDSESED